MFYTYKFISNLDVSLTTAVSSPNAISKRTEVLHGEQNVVNTVLRFTSKAKSRIEACVGYSSTQAVEVGCSNGDSLKLDV
jgi:hypothetical protein